MRGVLSIVPHFVVLSLWGEIITDGGICRAQQSPGAASADGDINIFRTEILEEAVHFHREGLFESAARGYFRILEVCRERLKRVPAIVFACL